MPAITLSAFVSGHLKPRASEMANMYYACKRALNTYNALNLGQNVPNDTVVLPGSDLTGAECIGVVYAMQDFVTYCEAGNLVKLFSIIHGADNP